MKLRIRSLRPSEHETQAALIDWSKALTPRHPELALLYAIPNAGKRGKLQRARLLAEGLRAGVPDLCLPVPRQGCGALYLELKVGKNVLTPDQVWWVGKLNGARNRAVVVYGFDEAKAAILEYLAGG